MGPFDFLANIGKGLSQYFHPDLNQVSSTLEQFFPSKTLNFRMDKSSKAPDIHPLVKAAAAKPPVPQGPSTQDIQSGLKNFGGNPPIASQAGLFSQAGAQLPPKVDPLLPVIIALMETGGGQHMVANSNPFNIRGIQDGNTQFIDYPDLSTALLGGNNNGVPAQGFLGQILNSPNYHDFRNSGNLVDFFNKYTPPGPQYGNPSLEDLVSRYQAIRKLFPEGGVQ